MVMLSPLPRRAWVKSSRSPISHLARSEERRMREITAERGDNVYRIFESINNTGVGLSQSDLLRNYVFMLLPGRGERVYEQLWLPMLPGEQLG